jgi:hypothetical protein
MTSTVAAPTPAPPGRSGPARPPTPPPPDGGDRASEQRPRSGPLNLDARTIAIDAIALGGLGALGIFGFNTAYGGTRYFLAGVVGLVAGTALAILGARKRLGVLVMAVLMMVVYFVVGTAVVAPRTTVAGFIPTPDSLAALMDGAVAGWAKLLTSLPPVGDSANLLAVPFLCGLLCGVLSLTVSLRTRRPLFAILFPTAVLVLGILFGTDRPASLLLQGAVFAVVALSWASFRYQQDRRIDIGRRRSTRWMGALSMLGLAALLATMLGTSVPGARSHPRMVLRDQSEPPFDPSDYPSPLAGYRRFSDGAPKPTGDRAEPAAEAEADPDAASGESATSGWYSTPLFEVRGLPDGEPIRLATLDTYSEGIVYQVGSGAGSSGYFQRVGTRMEPKLDQVPEELRGDPRTVEIKVLEPDGPKGYHDIWVPLPENVTSVEFSHDGDGTFGDDLRFNLSTGAAALPSGLSPGDSYTVTMVPVAQPRIEDLGEEKLGEASLPDPYQPPAVESASAAWAQGVIGTCAEQAGAEVPAGETTAGGAGTTTVQKLQNLATNLHNCGSLDDGQQSQAGHGAYRLGQMVAPGGQALGNGEQFAPLGALMADAVGIPARVVMGFRSKADSKELREREGLPPQPEDHYEVTGAEVDAWIEVNIEGLGWVPIDVVPDEEKPVVLPQPEVQKPQNEPPPPPPSVPPSEEDEVEIDRTKSKDPCEADPDQPECREDGFAIPGWVVKAGIGLLTPIAALGMVTGIIGGLKARRRKRRRNDGSLDARVNGGWKEITDLACDIGSPVPAKMTRREAAGLIGDEDSMHLARHADGAVFGPNDLSEGDVDRLWSEVDAVRRSMVSGLSRFGRWKVLVSLNSLRLSAQRSQAARRDARNRRRAGGGSPAGRPTGGTPPPGGLNPDIAGGAIP